MSQGASQSGDPPSTAAASTARPAKLLRSLLVLLCVFHMAATVLVNFPNDTVLGPGLRAWLTPYFRVASLWQHWSMFQTIPYFASIDPKLVVRTDAGREEILDPVLPGLRPFDASRRETALFLRLGLGGQEYRQHLALYLRRACRAATARLGAEPESVTLRLDAMRLLPLEEVVRTRQIAKPTSTPSGLVQRCR